MNYAKLKEISDYRSEKDCAGITELRRIIKAIQQYVNIDKVALIYPRNIFSVEGHSEVFLFMQDNQVIIIQSPNKNIVIRRMYKDNILECELIEYGDGIRNLMLTIKLKNGESIILDSKTDSNSDWEDSYKEMIIEIYNFI